MEPRKPLPPVLWCGGAEQHVREVVERLRSMLRVEDIGVEGKKKEEGRKKDGRKKVGRKKEGRGKEEDEKGQ